MILLPDYVLKAMNALNESGYECYVVGGAIRSALLHLPVHDYDLTTNALPEEMKKVFRNWHTFDTGIQHGTITVLSDHHPLEITTYRKDSTYKDHRHPDSVSFTSRIEEDCSRRTFSMAERICTVTSYAASVILIDALMKMPYVYCGPFALQHSLVSPLKKKLLLQFFL